MKKVIRHARQPSILVLVLLMTLLPCAAVSGAEGQGENIDRVLNQFPGWHLLTLQERDSETRNFFLRHFPKSNPSVVHADFDGDGRLDYALLLRESQSGATKLVVLLCSGDSQCKSVYELDVTGYSDFVYLRPVTIGSRVSQTDALNTNDGPSAVKLNCTGIRVTYFGKGEVVLYWSKKLKKIEEIQTED